MESSPTMLDSCLTTEYKKLNYCPKTSLLRIGKQYAKDFVYRHYNDTIPENFTVTFKDGDMTNINISNLILVAVPNKEKKELSESCKNKLETIRKQPAKGVIINGVPFKSQYAGAKFLNINAGHLHSILNGKTQNNTGYVIQPMM